MPKIRSRTWLIAVLAASALVTQVYARGGAAFHRQAGSKHGYHGPESLGTFSVDTPRGWVSIQKIWEMLGKPNWPAAVADTFCYHDPSTGTYR